jgi:anti-sigma-K factor RskA
MNGEDTRAKGTCQRDPWAHRLSEYLDGDLPATERLAIEDHLAVCTACAAVVQELREVVARAGRMRLDSAPARDLWPGIRARLRNPSRLASLSLPRAGDWRRAAPRLAAAAALVACCAAVAWVVAGRLRPAPAAPPVASAPAQSPSPAGTADRDYEATVAELRRVVHARLTSDPHVVEVLEKNLAALDVAMADYRGAISRQPGDAHLRSRLIDARARKLQLLRRAAALTTESGN